MTLAAFVRTSAPAPTAVAIRWGLVGLLAAQASGVWMLLHGLGLLDADADPLRQSMSTVGAAGQVKFAHAVPMHAIQVLVVLAWLLSISGLSQRRQAQLVALAVVGYAGLVSHGPHGASRPAPSKTGDGQSQERRGTIRIGLTGIFINDQDHAERCSTPGSESVDRPGGTVAGPPPRSTAAAGYVSQVDPVRSHSYQR